MFSHLKYAGRSDVGRKRTNNEDSFGMFPEAGVFCVSDGMGGGDDGEVASAATVKAVEDSCNAMHDAKEPPSAEKSAEMVGAAVNEASAWIHARAQKKRLNTCGATFVGVCFDLVDKAEAIVLHAGDSRLYLVRGRSIRRMTKDHSAAEMIGISNEEEINPMFRGVILRAVGIQPSVQIDRTSLRLKDGDRILICSDGLSKMVSDKDILSIMNANDAPGAAVDALIAAANSAGGLDNVTAVVINVGGTEKQVGVRRNRLLPLVLISCFAVAVIALGGVYVFRIVVEEMNRIAVEIRKADDAAKRRAEEERIAAERRKAEEAAIEAERLKEERRRAEEKRKAEEEARIKAAEEAKRQKAEEEAKRRAEEERIAAERRKAEEAAAEAERLKEERRRAEEKRKAEDEARIKAAEEAKRQKAEEEARRRAEEERIAAERRKAEEAAAEAERLKEERRRAEEKRKAEVEARIKAAEDARRRKAEDEVKRKVEEERKAKADEEARIKAAEGAKRRAEQNGVERLSAMKELKSACGEENEIYLVKFLKKRDSGVVREDAQALFAKMRSVDALHNGEASAAARKLIDYMRGMLKTLNDDYVKIYCDDLAADIETSEYSEARLEAKRQEHERMLAFKKECEDFVRGGEYDVSAVRKCANMIRKCANMIRERPELFGE